MLLTNLQKRLISSEKRIDYFILFVIALIPIIVSRWIGVHNNILDTDGNSYRGYWYSWNWTSLILFLPLSLFFLRWTVNFLFGSLSQASSDNKEVRLVRFFQVKGEEVQEKISCRLRKIASDYKIFFTVLFLDVIFHVADTQEIAGHYISYFKDSNYSIVGEAERDWSTFFLIKGEHINVCTNLLFNIIAYINQFIIVFICWSLIIFLFRYNWFYLHRIYRRSRIREEDAKYYIILNFDDQNLRFGLEILNPTFNIQILLLGVFGFGLLVSRYLNLSTKSPTPLKILFDCLSSRNDVSKITQCIENLKSFDWNQMFPDVGQIVIAIAWMLFAFLIVGLPACVKFLPIVSYVQNRNIELTATSYLREFVPPEIERTKYPSLETNVDALAGKFRNNSFWPGGDDLAQVLLYFAFVVFFVMLSPIGLNLLDVVYVLILALFATIFTQVLLKCPLRHIDKRLVFK